MNPLNDITDEDFVPFLSNLGAETYKKSFEWMLNDREFAGVLRWMYKNLDQNNALNAREECRYNELETKGKLLSPEDLESSIASIQDQYEGICLPGEQETLEDVKLDIKLMKERLYLLEKQEAVLTDLQKQNKLINEELSQEITKLHAAQQQSVEDEKRGSDECILLAQEVETITEGVIDVIADTLNVYGSVHTDKENAKKFFTFGPFESYRQAQALYRSHFDLYTSKKFSKKQNDAISDDELRTALVEAKSMEERLSDAICAYIESKAELSGEHAKLALVANYSNVHPSQITPCMVEAQSALDLLEQEESILDQQLQTAVKQLVEDRTNLAVETTAKAALTIREQVHSDLSHLLETTQRALYLDRVVYVALRHELRTLEDCLQFAAHLRRHVMMESDAVQSRIDSMNEIRSEQEACEIRQQTDLLLNTLFSIFGVPTSDGSSLVKLHADLLGNSEDLKTEVVDGFRRKEEALVELVSSTKPLRQYVWDGCTKQPNNRDRVAASLAHSLRQKMEEVDKQVSEASSKFTAVKNGDKKNLRKIWQWFLTDPSRLHAAMKNLQGNNYL